MPQLQRDSRHFVMESHSIWFILGILLCVIEGNKVALLWEPFFVWHTNAWSKKLVATVRAEPQISIQHLLTMLFPEEMSGTCVRIFSRNYPWPKKPDYIRIPANVPSIFWSGINSEMMYFGFRHWGSRLSVLRMSWYQRSLLVRKPLYFNPFTSKNQDLQGLCKCLLQLPHAQIALYLMCQGGTYNKIQYWCRTMLRQVLAPLLHDIHDYQKQFLEQLIGKPLTPLQWTQAKLPTKAGGLGLMSPRLELGLDIVHFADLSFLASLRKCRSGIQALLPLFPCPQFQHLENVGNPTPYRRNWPYQSPPTYPYQNQNQIVGTIRPTQQGVFNGLQCRGGWCLVEGNS